jgi:hypothetical protein
MSDVTTNNVYIEMEDQYDNNVRFLRQNISQIKTLKKQLDICEKKLALLEGRHNSTQSSGSMASVVMSNTKSTGNRSLRQSSRKSSNALFNAAEAAVKKCKEQSGFGYYY